MKVPLVDLAAQHATIRDEVLAAATAVIDAQAFVLGEPVASFERTLATICGTKHAVGVASGSDALVLALRALGIGAGDAVVTPAFSFVASAEAIAVVGARPIFADIDLATFAVSSASIDACIARHDSSARGTLRAILPVHLFGLCADMDALLAIAQRHGLSVVEDAAQAIGASFRGRAAGSMGDAGCISFFPTKNLGAWGDGGAVVTSRDDVAARVTRLRAHGMSTAYRSEEIGTNSRLDALQAAVLGVKARHLASWNLARARVASRYRERLADLAPRLVLPAERDGATHAYNQFVVRTAARDSLAAYLAERGVATRVYYPLTLPRQPCFAHLAEEPASFPAAEEATRTALALPVYPEISDAAIDYVSDQVREFFAR